MLLHFPVDHKLLWSCSVGGPMARRGKQLTSALVRHHRHMNFTTRRLSVPVLHTTWCATQRLSYDRSAPCGRCQ